MLGLVHTQDSGLLNMMGPYDAWQYSNTAAVTNVHIANKLTCWPLLGTGMGRPALMRWKNHSSTGL